MAISFSTPSSDYGAFIEKFTLASQSSLPERPLKGLTFAVKDIFNIEGHVTGFGNPDWARTHSAAASTAPVVVSMLEAGATCVGKTIMDEMAYSINGENAHYGTPINPRAAERVPGGSSSGSAVAVSAFLTDFSLGTDTGGSIRVPASYCGIFGFRPSHGIVSTSGVIPMAQSFDTVGWFARDPVTLKQVGKVLLKLRADDHVFQAKHSQLIVAKDCFNLLNIPHDSLIEALVSSVDKLNGGQKTEYINLGAVIGAKVPSLKHFLDNKMEGQENKTQPLAALSSAFRLLQRYEFKSNHGEWVESVRPNLGPGIAERVQDALRTTSEHVDECLAVKTELRGALTDLLGDSGILAMPTVPGPPPKLQTETAALEVFRANAFSLLSIAGMSGFCQVSIPFAVHDSPPVGVSLVAKHGSDGLLLDFVEEIHRVISI